jgi:hypothetical protein
MTEIRADRIKVGTVLSGMPNRTVTAVEHFEKSDDRRCARWVRLNIHRPATPDHYPARPEKDYVAEFPADWKVDYWPARDMDDEEEDE